MATAQAVWVLTRAQLFILRNTLWRGGKIWGKLALLVVPFLVLGLSYFIFWITSLVVTEIQGPEFRRVLLDAAAATEGTNIPTDLSPYLLAVPSVVLFIALLLLIFTSFASILNALYLSGDMDMLLVMPVPMRAVFIVKFFGALLSQYALLLIIGVPFLIGYGRGMDYGWLYYGTSVGVILLLPLLPGGLGAILTMAVVRVLPPQQARNIVGILGGVIGVLFYLGGQLSSEWIEEFVTASNLNFLLQLNFPLLPSAWAARALTTAGEGQLGQFIVYGSLFAAVSVGTYVGCLLLAERLYYVGWSNVAQKGGKVRRRKASTRAKSGPRFRLLPQAAWVIFVKDWRLAFRDFVYLQHLIFPLALVGLWTFRLLAVDTSDVDAPPGFQFGPDIASDLGSLGLAFYLCVTISNAVAGTGINQEGKTFWILKLAPVPVFQILLGKFILAFLPYPTIGTIFLWGTAFISASAVPTTLSNWTLLMLVGLGSVCMTLGLASYFPKPDMDNVRQPTSFRAGCLSFIFYVGYVILMGSAVVGVPLLADFFSVAFSTQILLTVVGWSFALLLTAAAVGGGIWLGMVGLNKLDV